MIDRNNEKACVWLCDTNVWNSEKNDKYSSYAIGSPSVEMYMKAYNIYKTGNKNSTDLIYKIDDTSRKLGYLVGQIGGGDRFIAYESYDYERGVCPIVPLDI